ncbi:MAG: hypothetical protein E6I91_19720 [Chloroflexi bacterium]|nr:MAG: hypothetical protein E6I91_19720 [Chloroflexota bacterium]
MNVVQTFWMWTTGDFDETLTLSLDPRQLYLVETYLTKTDGGDYAHTYISETCSEAGDEILCGITNEPDATSVAVMSGDISVTVALRTTGGAHRAEGVLYAL